MKNGNRPRLSLTTILVAITVSIVSACAPVELLSTTQGIEECEVGEQCSIKGHLTLYANQYGSLGVLNIETECVALSLPHHIFERKPYWQDAAAQVEGMVYSQPAQAGIVSYELEGRSVLAGMCETGKILYVTQITRIEGSE